MNDIDKIKVLVNRVTGARFEGRLLSYYVNPKNHTGAILLDGKCVMNYINVNNASDVENAMNRDFLGSIPEELGTNNETMAST